MSKKQTIAAHIREIKQLNARLRPLVIRKEALVDATQAICSHPKALERLKAPGVELRRICCACGLMKFFQKGNFGELTSANATQLEFRAYIVEQKKLLKKLGINL